jgi:Uma2 family endonuclease
MFPKAILTYEDYLVLPETMQRYEIIDGVLIMPPAPLIGHQWQSDEICDQMRAYIKQRQLGLVLSAPVDVMIRRTPLRTRQPDILYISLERLEEYGLEELQRLPYLDIAPDLVVEIISPSESAEKVVPQGQFSLRHIEDKLTDYQRIGVRECWLVRSTEKVVPQGQFSLQETIEVVRFTDEASRVIAVFRRGERVQSHVLPGWQPAVDALLIPLTSIKKP